MALTDGQLAEIGLIASVQRWSESKSHIEDLLEEINRLKRVIADVSAAPRGYVTDPNAGMDWAVTPAEFLEKLDREMEPR